MLPLGSRRLFLRRKWRTESPQYLSHNPLVPLSSRLWGSCYYPRRYPPSPELGADALECDGHHGATRGAPPVGEKGDPKRVGYGWQGPELPPCRRLMLGPHVTMRHPYWPASAVTVENQGVVRGVDYRNCVRDYGSLPDACFDA